MAEPSWARERNTLLTCATQMKLRDQSLSKRSETQRATFSEKGITSGTKDRSLVARIGHQGRGWRQTTLGECLGWLSYSVSWFGPCKWWSKRIEPDSERQHFPVCTVRLNKGLQKRRKGKPADSLCKTRRSEKMRLPSSTCGRMVVFLFVVFSLDHSHLISSGARPVQFLTYP